MPGTTTRSARCLALFGACALAIVGCGEVTSPTHVVSLSEIDADDELPTDFAATIDFGLPIDPGDSRIVDDVLIFRGQINEGTFIDGDLEGTARSVVNGEIDLTTFMTTAHGSLDLSITSVKGRPVAGGWSGTSEGQGGFPALTVEFNATGSGGLRRTRLESVLTNGLQPGDPQTSIFTLSGQIVRK